MYNEIKAARHYFIVILMCALLIGACQGEKDTPLPATDLEARNQLLKEVKERLLFLETANEGEAVQLLNHRDHRVRRRAARRLGDLRVSSQTYIEKLSGALDDPHRNVRIEAAAALAKLNSHETLDPLIKALVDEDYKVRLWAYKGLVRSKERSVPLLIKHLSDQSPYRTLNYVDAVNKRHSVRELLVECLSNIGKPAVPALRKALSNESLLVRTQVANILGKIGRQAEEAIQELLEVANSEDDIELRKSAIVAIGDIGDVDPEVTPTLLSLSHGANSTIAQHARKALKKIEEAPSKEKSK